MEHDNGFPIFAKGTVTALENSGRARRNQFNL